MQVTRKTLDSTNNYFVQAFYLVGSYVVAALLLTLSFKFFSLAGTGESYLSPIPIFDNFFIGSLALLCAGVCFAYYALEKTFQD